jgi:hypothetical protein
MRDNIHLRRKRRHVFGIVVASLLNSILFIFLSRPESGFAQIPIPEDIKKVVTFLFTHDGKEVKGVGTGFNMRLEDGPSPGYLVTAKHVLMADSKNYFPKLCLKLNNMKGGSELIPIELSGPQAARVFVHSKDPNVDIAVIPVSDINLAPNTAPEDYDFAIISASLLATKEHFAKGYIKEGDETFFTGWFRGYFGITRNYPIVRFGRLALLTDEKIPWNDKQGNQLLNLYLIEALASGGTSGSPVFFRPSLQREPGMFITDKRPTLLLAGVLKGYFGDESSQNTGIAAVVPAFQLHEILFSDEVKNSLTSAKPLPALHPNQIQECHNVDKIIRKTLGQ